MDTVLVYGYVREIERSFQKIIPIDIYDICFDYYFATKFIFYVTASHEMPDSVMRVCNMDTNKSWHSKIFESNDIKTEITKDDIDKEQWSLEAAAITFARNVQFPTTIIQNLNTFQEHNFKCNNVIFRCGGKMKIDSRDSSSDYSGALIIDSHQFQKGTWDSISAYNWKLPKFPIKVYSNYALFSDAHSSLYSIGGTPDYLTVLNDIYKLSFDGNDSAYMQQDLEKWKWETLDIKLEKARSSACCAMVDNSTKMIVCAGYGADEYEKTVELLDLNGGKSVRLESHSLAREDGGIFYDELNKNVYIGGGYHYSKKSQTSVERYDFGKNVWDALPKTCLSHDMNPMIWNEEHLLYIMSVRSNGVECIDLREGKEWSVKIDELGKLFGTEFNFDRITRSRLIGN